MDRLSLDLQIHICKFLHPSQIISLRLTCKAFHEATTQRIVWIDALNRICHQNFLFLPTFPIPDMSDAELERAAIAPRRWIALSSSKDRTSDGLLPSRSTRVIYNPNALEILEREEIDVDEEDLDPYLVPGGRYLVMRGRGCLGVWDLGYDSDEEPSRIWVTRQGSIEGFIVQPTGDGLRIRILAHTSTPTLYVFEIYPAQNDTHKHTKVAELTLEYSHRLNYFLYGQRVVIYNPKEGMTIIWDFVTNTMASWQASIPDFANQILRVTDTAIILVQCYSATPVLWIFKIPPLTSKPSHFGITRDLPEIEPILTFKYPEATEACFQMPDSWYFGSCGDFISLPLYLDVYKTHRGGDVGRYTLDIASDLSHFSLSLIPNAPMQPLILRNPEDPEYYNSEAYRICDDSLVNIPLGTRGTSSDGMTKAFTVGFDPSSDGYNSSQIPTTHVNTTPFAKGSLGYAFCPASARFVYQVFIFDFL